MGTITFERCTDGLPWFDHNIDTSVSLRTDRLSRSAPRTAGVFRSLDGGVQWHLMTVGLPKITTVTIS